MSSVEVETPCAIPMVPATPVAEKKRKFSSRVKRACENCKRAKRCCDNGRPCTRCVRLGMESSCQDATRKSKGDVCTPDQTPSKKSRLSDGNADTSSPGSEGSPVTTPQHVQAEPVAAASAMSHHADSDLSWFLTSTDLTSVFEPEKPTINAVPTEDAQFKLIVDELNYFKIAAQLRAQVLPGEEEVPLDIYDKLADEVRMLWPSRRTNTLFRAVPGETAVWLVMGGRVVDWNHAACSLYGYESADMAGTSWKDFFPQAEHLAVAKNLANAWKSGAKECTTVHSVLSARGLPVVSQVNFVFLPLGNTTMFPQYLLCLHSPL